MPTRFFSKAKTTTFLSTKYSSYSCQTWLITISRSFTANVYKALLEMFPPVDLGHLPLHPVSPIQDKGKSGYISLNGNSSHLSLKR